MDSKRLFLITVVAVLYYISSVSPKGLAEFFKSAFEAKEGAGSVVAFESFLPTGYAALGYDA